MRIIKLKSMAKRALTTLIYITTFFAAVGYFSNSTRDVYAGDINGSESGVIGVASGTFTYNGKVYKAYSSYVSQLYSYLSRDDVDLTPEQASKAISYIYSNVQQGIDQGYVYEVKEPEENNTDLNQIEEEREVEEQKEREEVKAQSDKEVEEMFEEMEEDHKLTQESRPKASETDASVIMTNDSIIITDDSDEEIVLKADESIIPDWFGSCFIIIGASVLVINIIILLVLIIKGCMRFKGKDRNKAKKGHRKRRRIRRICRRVLTATTAIGVTTIFVGITISIGLFNNNKIIQNIQGSGYFKYAYTEYVAENSEFVSYDEFLLDEKKALDMMEAGEMTKGRSLAPYISRMQTDLKDSLIASGIMLILATIVSVVACIFMDMRRDRGIRSIAIAVLIGTVITLVIGIIMKALHIENQFFIEPEYLYEFLRSHLEWCIKILLITGLFGAVISMSLIGVYRSKRKDH